MGAQFEHDQYIGVIQGRSGSRFLLEAAKTVRIGGDGGRQYLDGYVPAKMEILRTVDLAHPSATELF